MLFVLIACVDNTVSQLPNTAPEATILAPLDGGVVLADEPLTLAGSVYDKESAESALTVWWSSTEEGELGAVAVTEGRADLELRQGLAEGEHELVLEAVDHEGLATLSAVVVMAEPNLPPAVSWLTPATDSEVPAGSPLTAVAAVEDDHTPTEDLVLIARSSEHGQLDGEWAITGTTVSFALPEGLPHGAQDLILEAWDAQGELGSDAVPLVVTGDDPPSITITAPEDGATYDALSTVIVTAQVDDDLDRGSDLGLSWSGITEEHWIDEAPPTTPTDAGTATFTFVMDCTYYGGRDETLYDVTVRVEDAGGQTAEATVTFWSDCLRL